MPCRSDYREPDERDVELSHVLCLLEELNTGKPVNAGSLNWDGHHPGAYRNTKDLDSQTAELCSRLQRTKDVTKYSLEMQIWWRDHQKADAARLLREQEDVKNNTDRLRALNKLTERERRLLGLK